MTEKEYLENRVLPQRNYFSKKAASNKKGYYVVSIAKLVISLLVTVLSSASASGGSSPISIVIAILSALMTLVEGIMLLCKYNENWIIYRMTSESIKKEEYLFRTHTGIYCGEDSQQAFNAFVQNFETLIQSSNKQWESVCKNRKEK